MKFRYIFWDWNGTVLDDIHVALQAVNRILADHDQPPITLEQYYRYLDTPIRKFYAHLFDLEQVPFAQIAAAFHDYYHQQASLLRVQEATMDLLRTFRQAGCCQVILSASHRAAVLQDAKRFQVLHYFDAVLGADDLLAESKLERAAAFVQEHRVDPAAALLIGDTLHDFSVADALGFGCALVASGHQARLDLCRCGAPVFDTMAALRDAVLTWWND